MSSKIEVSREQYEQFYTEKAKTLPLKLGNTPVRYAGGQCVNDFALFGWMCWDAAIAIAAPPELAELQAENSSLRLQCGGMETEIAELRSELDRLKGWQGEPVDAILLENCEEVTVQDYGRGYFATDDCVAQLYRSQPAPVSVALPEREEKPYDFQCEENQWTEGWNACLDKVKELNT